MSGVGVLVRQIRLAMTGAGAINCILLHTILLSFYIYIWMRKYVVLPPSLPQMNGGESDQILSSRGTCIFINFSGREKHSPTW